MSGSGVPPREKVLALASRHGGIVTRRQLRRRGLSDRQVDRLVQQGWLISLHTGVFAVGHVPTDRRSHFIAGLLACGPQAALSHHTAAELWELGVEDGQSVHITTDRRTRRSTRSLTVHKVRAFSREDVGTCRRLRVTRVPRTLLDLADVLDDHAFELVVSEAKVRRLVVPSAIASVVARSPGRRGRRLIDAVGLTGRTRSELERRFRRVLRAAGLRVPDMNLRLHGMEVDAYWPEHRLVVELDSYDFHDNKRSFRTDRAKDRRLLALGYVVLRYTWDDLGDGTAVRELSEILGWDTSATA